MSEHLITVDRRDLERAGEIMEEDHRKELHLQVREARRAEILAYRDGRAGAEANERLWGAAAGALILFCLAVVFEGVWPGSVVDLLTHLTH